MPINQKNLDAYLAFAERFIKKSEKIILVKHKQSISVQYKNDRSPVTKIDKLIESNFRKEIKEKYPTHGIYGEEFKNLKTNNEFIWVIDPIDGTKNFIHGNHAFGTLITLLYHGAPIFGIINSPLMKKTWKGIKGKGAYLNNKKIKKNKSSLSLKEIVISHSGMSAFKEMPENKIYDKIGKIIRYYIFGGDCVQYGLLAEGKIPMVAESDLKPFDFLPLVNLIEETGGIISDWRGNQLSLKSAGNVVASISKKAHSDFIKISKTI
jgi:inositol-phosphate phosphatase/L-galactose 1-phosphate phosphatase/histidinol-phosphatase|tara:strand:+ start:774 stop:1568 length:795 start_codon:yes stop_codon:yes gene_type:complete